MTNIRALRQKRHWTQAKLADLSGVPRVNITRYENGTREPRVTAAIKIAQALGVTLTELIGFEFPERPEETVFSGVETPEPPQLLTPDS